MKLHCFIGPVLLLYPKDDGNTRLVFFSVHHTGKHIVDAGKELAVLLPVPCVPAGIKAFDQDIMAAHVCQAFVIDNLHDQANRFTVEITQPVYLM